MGIVISFFNRRWNINPVKRLLIPFTLLLKRQISNEIIELFDSAEIAFMQIRLDTTTAGK